MSEQEYDGLTLEGLAKRVEALERGEAGKDQTGEETAAEFVRPPSRGEQEYEGLTLQALAHRVEMLEQENALLRERALGEARDVSTFDVVHCNRLDVADLAIFEGSGLSATNNFPSLSFPQPGISGHATQPGGRGVQGAGLVGVHGFGTKRPGETEDSVGVHGFGGTTGVRGEAYGAGRPGKPAIGVLGESADIGVKGIVTREEGLPFTRHGVVGAGPDTGVLGQSNEGKGVWGRGVSAGVLGEGIPAADASEGSPLGYGGQFESLHGEGAQLRLLPGNRTGAPNARLHRQGEIYMDSEATLFVCTADGTPGTWERFQTTPAP